MIPHQAKSIDIYRMSLLISGEEVQGVVFELLVVYEEELRSNGLACGEGPVIWVFDSEWL